MGTLTGENPTVHAISTAQTGQSVDFVKLFNPANKEQKANLVASATYDIQVNPAIDLTRDSIRQQSGKDISQEDPLTVIGAPPCTVFSPMQNINQKHHIEEGMDLLIFATQKYWDQIERGTFFLHEHAATASCWNTECIMQLGLPPLRRQEVRTHSPTHQDDVFQEFLRRVRRALWIVKNSFEIGS